MSTGKRSPRVADGRQMGITLVLSKDELEWLRRRAKHEGVTMSRLIRRGIARDSRNYDDKPPTTLCNAEDYSEGVCSR